MSKRNRFLKIALRRRFVASSPPAEDIQVCIVSPGGVGSSLLIETVSRYLNTNCAEDSDGFKHMPSPPRNLRHSSIKYIFVYGNEEQIYASIRRRGWVAIQGAKLGCVFCVLFDNFLQSRFFVAAVRRQIRRWQRRKASNLMTLSYDDLWNSTTSIARFLEIDEQVFVKNFPKRRERLS